MKKAYKVKSSTRYGYNMRDFGAVHIVPNLLQYSNSFSIVGNPRFFDISGAQVKYKSGNKDTAPCSIVVGACREAGICDSFFTA